MSTDITITEINLLLHGMYNLWQIFEWKVSKIKSHLSILKREQKREQKKLYINFLSLSFLPLGLQLERRSHQTVLEVYQKLSQTYRLKEDSLTHMDNNRIIRCNSAKINFTNNVLILN